MCWCGVRDLYRKHPAVLRQLRVSARKHSSSFSSSREILFGYAQRRARPNSVGSAIIQWLEAVCVSPLPLILLSAWVALLADCVWSVCDMEWLTAIHGDGEGGLGAALWYVVWRVIKSLCIALRVMICV